MAVRRRMTRSSQRRKRVWARTAGANTVIVPAGVAPAQVDLLAVFRAAGGDTLGSTVARVRCDINIEKTVGVSAGILGQWGIIVGPTTMDAVDQDPAVDLFIDWMFWGAFVVPDAVGGNQSYTLTDGIDVKSMRKMEELQQTLWFVANTNLAGMTNAIEVSSSTLLLLP